MNGQLAEHHPNPNPEHPVELTSILAQLDSYKRKSERLSRMNELHLRLAGATDVTSVLESFSVWLMTVMDHSLLAFQDAAKARPYMVCSSHGPDRRREIRLTEMLLEQPFCLAGGKREELDGYYYQAWDIALRSGSGKLLLSWKKMELPKEKTRIINESLLPLMESLQRARDYEALYEQARQDTLTGLSNRRVFEEHVPVLLERAKRHETPVTLMSMDLDNFKHINDTLGHTAGDEILQQVARLLSGMVRLSDLLVRMGGDEFLAILPSSKIDSAEILASRLMIAVRNLAFQTPGCERLGISIGLAEWRPGMTINEWLQKADDSLYRVKRANKSKSYG